MKKLLATSAAVAMLTFSGAAYAGNHAFQSQLGTILSDQAIVQVGNFNRARQFQTLTVLSSQAIAQGGFGNRATQVQFGTFGSTQSVIQVTP
jgi:hypothetical protein